MKSRAWFSLLVIVGVAIALSLTYLTTSREFAISDGTYTRAISDGTAVQFPANYKQQFVQYAQVDCPNSAIVRQMYVNRAAFETLKQSETVPSGTVVVMETHSARRDANNRLTSVQLNNVFIREKRSGWQVDSDSGEWQSAWYSPTGRLVSNHQGSCISCHTMVRDFDYLFTLPALLTAARTDQVQYQQTEFGTSVCR